MLSEQEPQSALKRPTEIPEAPRSFKEPLQRVFLIETDIRVAVAVLYAHNHISNYCNTGPVAEELLVRGLCVIFLRFYELALEVNVIRSALTELSHGE